MQVRREGRSRDGVSEPQLSDTQFTKAGQGCVALSMVQWFAGIGGSSINDDHGLTSPLLNTVSRPSSQDTGLMV